MWQLTKIFKNLTVCYHTHVFRGVLDLIEPIHVLNDKMGAVMASPAPNPRGSDLVGVALPSARCWNTPFPNVLLTQL